MSVSGRVGRSAASVIAVGALFPVLDTPAEVEARVVDQWRGVTVRERLDLVADLNRSCEQLAEAGVRLRYPGASGDEVRFRVLALRLGREVMVRVYGWDPAVKGW